MSTVFCAVVDPRDGSVRYSSAGHPPADPRRRAGRARLPRGGAAPPPGGGGGPRPARGEVVLPPGSTLLLYTDGFVERREEALDEGIARAVEALVAGPAPPPSLSDLRTEAARGRPGRRRGLPALPPGLTRMVTPRLAVDCCPSPDAISRSIGAGDQPFR